MIFISKKMSVIIIKQFSTYKRAWTLGLWTEKSCSYPAEKHLFGGSSVLEVTREKMLQLIFISLKFSGTKKMYPGEGRGDFCGVSKSESFRQNRYIRMYSLHIGLAWKHAMATTNIRYMYRIEDKLIISVYCL